MQPLPFDQLFSGGSAEMPHLAELFVRMAIATLLGACVAYRVWRPLIPSAPPPTLQGAQAQTLVAAAGAIMVVVIGDHPARAFGLVGLGSFIRFRSGIRDPRDAAVMFVMIGIGMACGLGVPLMAAEATVLVCLILMVFDATARRMARRTTVTLNAEDPAAALAGALAAFPRARVVEIGAGGEGGKEKDRGKLVLELDLRGDMDAAQLRTLLEQKGAAGLRRVELAYVD